MSLERKNDSLSHPFRVSSYDARSRARSHPVLGLPEDPSSIPPLSSQQLSLEHVSVHTSCDLSLSFRKPFPWRPVPMAVWPQPQEPLPSWSLSLSRWAVPICLGVLQEHRGFRGPLQLVWSTW